MTYAVNICDLLAVSKTDPALHMVIALHVDAAHVVEAERGRVAGIGHAAVLTCPEEQAAALIQVVRQKLAKYQFRFYASKTGNGGWKRV
jgi:hypothetical protein